MEAETKEKLFTIFEKLCASTYKDVPGVMVLTDDGPGPVIGITVCTHGNEPSGLFAVAELLAHIEERTEPVNGKVLVILNNIEATRNYFRDYPTKNGQHRFVDINMNRLPADVLGKKVKAYEEQRVQELKPVWNEIEYGLDIHSTTLPTTAFIVNPGADTEIDLVSGLPIQKVLTNVDTFTSGLPAVHFYGTKERPARCLGIECGSHEDMTGFVVAAESVLSFLRHFAVLSGERIEEVAKYEIYEMSQTVYFPDETYELARDFGNFEQIAIGEHLLKGEGKPVVAKQDGHTFFASPGSNHGPTEEALFLSLPKQIVSL